MNRHPGIVVSLASLLFSVSAFGDGFPADEAVGKMRVAPDFKVQLFASEPMVRQPVAIDFDNRGRLWVIQYLQYPNPAGLTRVKVDRYSRTVYDKVPEPPPHGPKGADRITILEDTDGDGKADKTKDFISDLNLASGLAFGHGGVFVLQVPYLLFYPDRNRDDVPDGDPEVLFTGFGMEDAHSVANSLTWGPDGWLYGCQGSTVTANIRGIEFQQGVWRYHPPTKRFELFCEGGGNSWGVDFDEDGNLIYATNHGGYRGFHGVQGGYYWKSFAKHGALHNPYTYGYFDHMPHDNFVGGHVTVGGMIYQSEALPPKYRGTYIHVDTLGHAVYWNKFERNGSTFQTKQGGEILHGNDNWFAPTDLTIAPDGSLYFTDWHDKRTAHPDPDADWDRSNGRIYNIRNSAGAQLTNEPLPDFATLSSDELMKFRTSKNNWLVRRARSAVATRRDVKVYPALRADIFANKDKQLVLESLWALYVSGGCEESFLNDLLKHPLPQVRHWAVRFLGDESQLSPTTTENLRKLAATELDVTVRSQLASTAKRLPAKEGLSVAQIIARRDLDAKDTHIPLLLWWAVERHCVSAINETLKLFTTDAAATSSLIRSTISPRLVRRYASESSTETLNACAELLKAAPPAQKQTLLVALDQGLSERAQTNVTNALTAYLGAGWTNNTRDELQIRILARLEDIQAVARALELASDASNAPEFRAAMLYTFAEATKPNNAETLRDFIIGAGPDELKVAALDAYQQSNATSADDFVDGYANFSDRVRSKVREVVFSRPAWARSFLQAVDAGKIPSKEVPLDQLRQVSLHDDNEINALVRKHWGKLDGGTPEEKLADIRRFNNDLRAFAGDATRGRDIFLNNCAVCHTFFGEGKNIGPDLTHANRHDRDYLLTSIVDPSVFVRKEFLNYNIETKDGRMLSGLISGESGNSVTLVSANGEKATLNRSELAVVQESQLSLMPEGLLHPLKPQELRDLFAYLQHENPAGIKKNDAAKPREQVEWIKVGPDGKSFVGANSKTKFIPFGFNYDRDYKMRLLEDYWEKEWSTVAGDFREMKELGANVVRVHLQLGKFMNSTNEANQQALSRLKMLLSLAEQTGLYLDITGLACYRKADVPAWFDELNEADRWAAQAAFWEAIAKTCSESPAVFCYDLINEPVVPNAKRSDWLVGELAGFWYVQAIAKDPMSRNRGDVAVEWTAQMVRAIRKHDKQHLVTIGLLPNSADEPGAGFPPQKVAHHLDFLCVHIYPSTGKLQEDLELLKKFDAGKPVVIEEIFPMHASIADTGEFIKKSQETATGWISFYWGQTPEELKNATRFGDLVLRDWLGKFQQVKPSLSQKEK